MLLIACLNIANLLLGQALGRQRELAIRAALGGGRTRLLRQLLTESLLYALAGGTLGIGMALAVIRYFAAVNPVEMPIGTHVQISWPVLAFTAGVSVVTSALCGILPARKASRLNATESLKSGGRGSIATIPRRLAGSLVAAEVAISLILLAGAGLLVRSVINMDSEPLGFKPDGLVLTQITLPQSHYPDGTRRTQFYDRLISKFGDQAAIATNLPPGGGASSALHVSGRKVPPELEKHDVGEETVSSAYLKVLGIPLLRGRNFDSRDRGTSDPVVLMNESVAGEYFAGTDPIGPRIRVGDAEDSGPWRTVIGIVGNAKTSRNYHQIGWAERAQVLRPLSQDPPSSVTVAIRGPGHTLESELRSIDNYVAIGDVETMQGRFVRLLAYPKFRAFLLGAFASLALLLAAVGLYAVLRQFVAQRTQEIGVRMAVGAQPGDVLRFILLQAARPLTAGLLAGLVGALVCSRFLVSLLYGIRPTDPTMLFVVSSLLIAVAGLATVIPSRQATRVDPMIALRNE